MPPIRNPERDHVMNYIVNPPCGSLRGVAGRVSGTAAYKGIRYATAGRWEYPKEVTHWEGVYDATGYGHCSYQPRAFYNEEENLKKVFYYNEFRKGEHYTYSEDCLFLNIFTPESAQPGDKLPVLFYIHGGGFTGGCGHEKHFDGPVWPKKGVIGVTINYRLGPMGFVCLPQLRDEAGFTGNYGLFDQMTALQWVRRNISAFGGDPENITIMGQSAGAMSVQQHCLSPLTRGLFHRAVMSSGGGVSKMLSAAPAEKSFGFWEACMKAAGCDSLTAFRAISPAALFDAWQKTKKEVKGGGCFPCIDGRFVVGTAAELVDQGQQHHIQYMAGSTSHDMMPPILFAMARDWCAQQDHKSYCWFFDRMLPGDKHGAWHSSDLWYWFGTLENCWRPMTDKDYLLSDRMTTYLCNFAATGSPNCKGLPSWHRAGNEAMRFGEGHMGMYQPNMAKLTLTMMTNKAVGE